MDNIDKECYNQGINFTEVKDFMDTHIYYKENRYYQELYTYLTKAEFENYCNNGNKALVGKECYDSKSEAVYQARSEKDTTGIKFMRVPVCISKETTLDLLNTETIEKIKKVYDNKQQSIDSAFLALNGKKISKEEFVIDLYCKQFGFGLIRSTKKIKGGQHTLKFITTREILCYKIVNCNVIDGEFISNKPIV